VGVAPSERLGLQMARVDRITQSLWYILFALGLLAIFQALIGLSLFPLYPLSVFIMTAHVWNFRWTCLPNIPDCAFDDILLWLDLFRPNEWSALFPVLYNMTGEPLPMPNATNVTFIGATGLFGAGEVSCPETSVLWSSVYLLSKTWLVYPLEFVIWATPYKDDFIRWITRSDVKEECLYLLGLDLIWIPGILYGIYVLWNVMLWGVRKAVGSVSIMSEASVAVYTLEKSAPSPTDTAVATAVASGESVLEGVLATLSDDVREAIGTPGNPDAVLETLPDNVREAIVNPGMRRRSIKRRV
jgi:hypothetical protein